MIADFITLFRGRGDVKGSWEGGCIREQLTSQDFANHLADGPHIGVYPAFNKPGTDLTVCVWGCTDIDHTDDPAQALLIRDVFASVDVKSWVERSRNGYHVWVFATELVPARDMRRMFLAAHQVANFPPKEVNPKQERLLPTAVGNYVRLPYPAYLSKGITERYVVDTGCQPIGAEEFVEQAMAHRVTPERIAHLADHYQPPQHIIAAAKAAPTEDMKKAANQLGRFAYVLWRDGPEGHRDRSSALQFLAYECAQAAVHPTDAYMLIKDADERWGKYSTRGDVGLLEIEKIVLRAYGPTAST